MTSDGNWPVPGLPYGRRKLTLVGRAHASKVSFLAQPRTHTAGQLRALATDRSRSLTRRWRAMHSARIGFSNSLAKVVARAACADEQILRNEGSTIRRSWQRSATTDIG